ncbi:MAG: hypothetical protein OSA83_04705 [Pseudomonadales bacterium]|jgi:hypothetical protein|nr:hypothetical protein [Pseudomonadales bacterium]|tara:strand:+ start:1089 stop:2951 length:1863 start_codon:yes stop_codon:yes gene_type:complete
MKSRLSWKKLMLVASSMAMLTTQNVSALEGDNWWVGGRLKQSYSWAYDLPNEGTRAGPSNFLAEISASASPTNNITLTGRFWVRGDLYPDIGDDITMSGIQDFTSPGFTEKFGFKLNENSVNNYPGLPIPFGAEADGIGTLSDFNDDIIRDLSLKYTDPKRRYSIKVGKFQRGWGQSDGIRLLDIVNAQDFRERLVLRDAEDLRIPAWMVAVDLKLWKLGMKKPFEALGMKRPSLELIYIPEVQHSRIIINNPTPSSSESGGLFGFAFPEIRDPVSGLGMPFLGANLNERTGDDFSDAEFGLRLSFEALKASWTLNAFYGQQDLPVVELTGADLVIGNAFNDPSQALVTVPLDLPTTLGAAHAPGGYMDFLRSLTTAPGSVAFPLAAFGCADILAGALPDCSLNLNFDLNYDYRQKVVGFSVTKDMMDWRWGRKDVSPVLRMEMSYEFDKPFNSNLVATPFGKLESGSPGLVTDPAQAIVERDVVSTMIGMDYFFWVPGWDSQRKSVFTSVQYFNIHTKDSDDLLAQAPYGSVEQPSNQNYVTFLWNLELMQERIFIEGLSIWDLDNDGFIHRQRIDFNFFGNNVRPRLEWISASGDEESIPAGMLRHSDLIELSITVQF